MHFIKQAWLKPPAQHLLSQLIFVGAAFLLCSCQPEDTGERRLRMAHVYEVSSPTHAYGTAFLSERLREKTDTLDITVYRLRNLETSPNCLSNLLLVKLI